MKQGSQKKRLAIGSMSRVGLRVANIVIALGMTPFIIAKLGDEDFGLWAVIGAFLGYYDLLDLGISAAISRYASASLAKQDTRKCSRVVSTAMAIYSVIAVIIVAVTVLLAGGAWLLNFPDGEGGRFAHIVLLLGSVQAIAFVMRVYSGVLAADLRFDLQCLFQFIALIVRTGLIIALLLSGFGVFGMAYASAGTYLLMLFLPFVAARRIQPEVRVRWSYVRKRTVRLLFSFSIFTFISNVSQMVRFRLDQIVVVSILTLTAVAHYQIAAMLIQNFRMGMDALLGVLFPYFSRLKASGDPQKMQDALFFGIRRAVQVSVFVGCGLIFWGMDFIVAWIDVTYVAAYPCLVALAIAIMCASSQLPSFQYLNGISKNRFLAVINSIEAVMNLGLSLVLIHYYGIVGVALGTAIPMILMQGGAMPIYVSRQLGVSPLVYMGNIARALGISAVAMVAPAYIALRFSQPSLVLIIAQGLIALVLYVIALWIVETLVAAKGDRHGPVRWALSMPRRSQAPLPRNMPEASM